MRKIINKAEVVIIIVVVLLSIIAWIYFNKSGNGQTVALIYHDGEIIDRVDLSGHVGEDYIHIESNQPVVIKVLDNSIGFVDAKCPDRLCEKTGMIQRTTQTAVCLPLKVAIVIEEKNTKSQVDMIAR